MYDGETQPYSIFVPLLLIPIQCSGELAHALRFLASVVSQSFLAFGDILELNRKFVELSGGINRIFELEELLDAAQSGKSIFSISLSFSVNYLLHLSIFNFDGRIVYVFKSSRILLVSIVIGIFLSFLIP